MGKEIKLCERWPSRRCRVILVTFHGCVLVARLLHHGEWVPDTTTIQRVKSAGMLRDEQGRRPE